eukprot:Skav206762  [mRNA]  locus=scaffold167:384381:393045:- [translate_table: standard]
MASQDAPLDAAQAEAEAKKVERWCSSNGVESTTDLAFMFTSYNEAFEEAGRAVARAWQAARDSSIPGVSGLVRAIFMAESSGAPPVAAPRPTLSPRLRPAAGPVGPSKAKAKAKSFAEVKRTFERPVMPGAKSRFIQLFVVMLTIIGVHRSSDPVLGDRVRANFHEMVTEVCRKSEVWLGGLPRVEDLPWLERNNVTLLASAMDKTAAECRDGVRRGPLQMKCCVAHSGSERAEEWARMKQIAVSTLAVGESVYVHCLAGVHRGPILAAALVGHVYSLDFDKVYDRIQQLRAIDKAGVISRRGGGETFTWARRACNAVPDPVRLHLPVTWIASERKGALWHVSSSHVGVGGGGRVQPACQFKKGRQQNVFKGEVIVADSLTEALLHGRPFCTICRGMVRAMELVALDLLGFEEEPRVERARHLGELLAAVQVGARDGPWSDVHLFVEVANECEKAQRLATDWANWFTNFGHITPAVRPLEPDLYGPASMVAPRYQRGDLIDWGCETLSDFTYMVNSEDEVKTVFIDTLANLDGPRIQAARLRHAWVACKALMESRKAAKTQAVVVEDDESLLPQDELLDLKAMWFRRYHLKPEPGCMPSDRLISKVVRSLRKHTLEVMDLWSVRSLTHQRTHGQKRRRIADGLFVQEVDDTEDTGVKNWAAYLKKLDIYLCALSIAGIVKAMPVRFPQEVVVAAMMALCPGVSWEGFRWPLIEDLLLQDDMLRFVNMVQNDEEWDGFPSPPLMNNKLERVSTLRSVGDQAGAASSSKAAPPLIPFGVGPDMHFEHALRIKEHGSPFEQFALVDEDLEFAARLSSGEPSGVRKLRDRIGRWFSELGRRWQPVTDHLRSFQPKEVSLVTKSRHLALIGLAMILCCWPDPTFMQDIIFGFPAVGFSPHVPCFAFQHCHLVTKKDILEGAWEDAMNIVGSLKSSPFDEDIVKAGMDDEAQFGITQATGKVRVIDDAAAGGQSRLSADANKLTLCNGLQPGIHAQLLWKHKKACMGDDAVSSDRLESGGEDLPNAYRFVPVRPEESWWAVVAYYDGILQAPRFRRYFGELFGLPLAVTSFNRWPKFFQALVRRIGGVVASMYFDDLSVQDWASNRGSAQKLVLALAKALGSPFASEKHQEMSPRADFLGLMHDFSDTHSTGCVRFWVRQSFGLLLLTVPLSAVGVS